MSLFEDTNPRELKTLLKQIHDCDCVLPDFQRDFVWDPSATRELIVSIAYNYPAGSLLRVRNTNNLFACREFQGAPAMNGARPTFLVLDGQQRLTSLYQAFFGVGEHRYYLDVKKLLDGTDFDECIFYLRAKHRRVKKLSKKEAQAEELVLPLSVLKGGAGGFGRWTRTVARTCETESERIQFEDRVADVEENWIRTIDDYKFPVVTLSDETSAEAVCTIFETLNRTGIKLTAFELLTARFWPLNINLRQLWDQAKAEYPIIEDFDVDPYYALQIISLASRQNPACKRSEVLNLSGETITEWWKPAIQGLAKGLEILRDDCGVIVAGWLPYNTIVVPLGAALARHGEPSAHEVGANRDKLCRWFWCSVFAQAYDNAANSQSAKDVTEIIRWLKGGEPPDTVTRFAFDPSVLRETTRRQRAVYRGTMCLILRRGPRDFYNGAKITGDLMIEQHIDDHHIFPNAWLGRHDVPNRLRDCILNRTLIDRKTNIRINDRPPSEYLSDVAATMEDEQFSRLLDSHLLPTGEETPLTRNDFDKFLQTREKALWAEICSATGFSGSKPGAKDEDSDEVAEE